MKLLKCSRETFVSSITDEPGDKFAKTFRAKADMLDKWDACYGLFIDGELAGAILTTVSKRSPKVANLQLLHTFVKFRRRGVGKILVQQSFEFAKEHDAKYLRVSAEKPAIEFYKRCGFVMLGEQKSGCQLSMFRLDGNTIPECSFDINDPVIEKAVFRKGKGGCVKVFVNPEKPSLENLI